MSAVAVTAPTQWAGAPKDSLANLGVYSGFTWRFNRLRLIVWALVTIGMIGFVAYYYVGIFGSAEQAATCKPACFPELHAFTSIAAAPPMNALIGTPTLAAAATIGGAIWCKYWMFGGVMLMIGMLYLTTRSLRGDEDAGRAELMRAYPLGLHSRLAATVWINMVASLVIGLLCGPMVAALLAQTAVGADGTMVGGGAAGAYVFGLSIAALGILGVGLGALVNQIAPTNGGANGLGIAIIGVFYVIRMIGDMNSSLDLTTKTQHFSPLIWASPIGWGQKMDPWGANKWWPALLQVALAAICVAIAWWLEQRRDLGAGLVAARLGSAKAARFTTTSVGLSLRTQRASIIAWLIGIMIMGDLLGSVVTKFSSAFTSLGGSFNMDDLRSVVALMASIMSLVIAAFAIQSVSTVRGNEEAGLAEAQLAGPVSRVGWTMQRVAVAFVVTAVLLMVAGGMMGYAYTQSKPALTISMASFVGSALIYLPAVAILMSVFILGFGWWPRQSVAVAWAVISLMFIFEIVGVATHIPQKVLDLMPFQALPAIPYEAMNWTPVLIESGIAIVLTVVGLIGFRRRVVPTV